LQNVGVHPEGLKNWINAGEPPRNSFQRELLETYEDVLKSLTYLECDR